jgi:hypothetical protein
MTKRFVDCEFAVAGANLPALLRVIAEHLEKHYQGKTVKGMQFEYDGLLACSYTIRVTVKDAYEITGQREIAFQPPQGL